MVKHEILIDIQGANLKIEGRTLRASYLSKVTEIILDVGNNNTFLTMMGAKKIENSNKVKSRWVGTVELKDWSLNELLELVNDLVKLTSCEKLIIDSNEMGRYVIESLIPILERQGKTDLIEFAMPDDVKNNEVNSILAEIDSKLNKLREIMDN